MSEENKAVIRRWNEMWNTGDVEIADEIFDTDWVNYLPTGPTRGIDLVKKQVARWRSAFPDLQREILDMVAEGDKVAVRFRVTGTHQGEIFGIAPTGKKIATESFTIRRIVGGKIVEAWTLGDTLGALKQMGVGTIPDQL